MSFKSKAIHGVFWISLTKYLVKAIAIATQLVLVRLLTPTDFGQIAIILVLLSSIQIFQDLGLKQTLIARKDHTAGSYNSAFCMSLGVGLVLLVALLGGAPVIAAFFGNETFTPLLRLLSIKVVLTSLSIVPYVHIQKDLEFKKLMLPGLLGTLAYALTALPLALAHHGVWSLAWAALVQGVVETGLIWFNSGWYPTQWAEARIVRELFSYSKYIISVNLATFLHRNVDTLMVGKLLGMTALGYYDQAFGLANSIPVNLMDSVAPIVLPGFSKIQERRDVVIDLHLRYVKYLILVLVPAQILLAIMARDAVLTLFGAKWEASVVPLQFLAMYALLRQVGATVSPIFIITATLRQWNYIVYLQLALLTILSVPAILLGGVVGMSVLMVAVIFAGCLALFYLSHRVLDVPLVSYLSLTTRPTIAVLAAAALMFAVTPLLPFRIADYASSYLPANLANMCMRGLIFGATYLTITLAADPGLRADLLFQAQSLLRRRRTSIPLAEEVASRYNDGENRSGRGH